jgi:uncharacterized coiled-coil protein SlyX
MDFNELLIQAIKKIDECILVLNKAREQPEIILTDIFSGESENFLTRTIESSMELTGEMMEVHDLQDYLYQQLIPYLSTIFRDIEFVYEDDKYPAPIQLFEGEREIGRINIYERSFIIVTHEDIKQEQRQLSLLQQQLEELTEEIKKYEGYQSNLLSYGETPVKKVYIAVRRKHFEKEIKSKYQELIELSMELEQQIISQRLKVEKIKESLSPYEERQYAIANYFKDKYGYQIWVDEE